MVVSINYVRNDKLDTLGSDDFRMPSFYSEKDASEVLGLYQMGNGAYYFNFGGQALTGWVSGIGFGLTQAEYYWTLFHSGKNIVAAQELIIEGYAIYDANLDQTTVSFTMYSYPNTSSDGGKFKLRAFGKNRWQFS